MAASRSFVAKWSLSAEMVVGLCSQAQPQRVATLRGRSSRLETLLCLSSVRTAAIRAFSRATCLRSVKKTSMTYGHPGCRTAKLEAGFVPARGAHGCHSDRPTINSPRRSQCPTSHRIQFHLTKLLLPPRSDVYRAVAQLESS
jgi:hypothetical protein